MMRRITRRMIMVLVLLATIGTAQAQQPQLKPWAGPDTVRHLYVLGGQAHEFTFDGVKRLGFPLLKYAHTKGIIEEIGGQTYRWHNVKGEAEIYRASPTDRGVVVENPLRLYVCEAGACKGWIYVVPPFRGVQVQPPAPESAPAPAPPMSVPAAPPQVLETQYQTAIYRGGKR